MLMGTVLQDTKQARAKEAPVTYLVGTEDDTVETLATKLETQADNYRRQYPQYSYRTLVGELTHEIEPPKPVIVKVRAITKVKK